MRGVALERLQSKIRAISRAVRTFRPQGVARSCVVILSPSLEAVQQWFHDWFPPPPKPPELGRVYAWVQKPADLAATLQAALDVQVRTRLTEEGFHLLDTVNQIFILGDLTDEALAGRLSEMASQFNQPNPFGNFFRIGIFVLHRMENGDLRKPLHVDECLQWASRYLDRLFLLGARTSRGIGLSRPEDLMALIGQLLYLLMTRPVRWADQPEGVQSFTEWMGRSRPSDGRCSTWTACSLLVPMDWLWTHILIRKGGEVLQRATLGDFPQERLENYFGDLMIASCLTTRDTLRGALWEAPGRVDPFHSPEVADSLTWDARNPETYLAAVEALNAILPAYADRDARLLESRAHQLLEEFRLNLLETVDKVIASSLGGVRMAQTLLERLLDHIRELATMTPDQPSYPDPQPLIQALRDEVRKGPRPESLALRAALFGALCGLGILHVRDFWGPVLGSLLLVTFLGIAGSFIAWHTWKHRVETLILKIQQALWDKWQALVRARTEPILNRMLAAYQDAVSEAHRSIRQASERIQTLVQWASQFFVPPDGESTFWVYVLRTPQDVERYVQRTQLDLNQAATGLLGPDSPLLLWKRVDPPAASKPNPWEETLLEKAAEAVLPSLQGAWGLSVCEVLQDEDWPDDRRDRFCELIASSTDFFLPLRPGHGQLDPRAILEISPRCSDFRNRLQRQLQRLFRPNGIEVQELPPNAFYLSLFTIVDGVNLQDVLWDES